MANKTTNYGLTKPLPEEFYDVNVQNENMDIIDAELKKRIPLNDEGKIPEEMLPPMDDYIPKSEKNVAGGVAPLNEEGKLPEEVIPEGIGGGKRTSRIVVGSSLNGWEAKDCDFLCDGNADEAEINQAIAALPSTGGEIVLLDGTYKLSESIIISKSNVTLKGNGNATKLVRAFSGYGGVDSLIMMKGQYGVVRDLYLDGAKGTYSQTYNNYGISLMAANLLVENCVVTNCGSDGIFVNGNHTPTYATIRGNTVSNCYIGISVSFCEHGTVTDNVVLSNSVHGIALSKCNYYSITGNISRLNGKRNIGLYWSNYNVVANNNFSVADGDSVTPSEAAITVQTESATPEAVSRYNVVSNNIVGLGVVINDGGEGSVVTTIRNIMVGETDLEAGSSTLKSGEIYLVYE